MHTFRTHANTPSDSRYTHTHRLTKQHARARVHRNTSAKNTDHRACCCLCLFISLLLVFVCTVARLRVCVHTVAVQVCKGVWLCACSVFESIAYARALNVVAIFLRAPASCACATAANFACVADKQSHTNHTNVPCTHTHTHSQPSARTSVYNTYKYTIHSRVYSP